MEGRERIPCETGWGDSAFAAALRCSRGGVSSTPEDWAGIQDDTSPGQAKRHTLPDELFLVDLVDIVWFGMS